MTAGRGPDAGETDSLPYGRLLSPKDTARIEWSLGSRRRRRLTAVRPGADRAHALENESDGTRTRDLRRDRLRDRPLRRTTTDDGRRRNGAHCRGFASPSLMAAGSRSRASCRRSGVFSGVGPDQDVWLSSNGAGAARSNSASTGSSPATRQKRSIVQGRSRRASFRTA